MNFTWRTHILNVVLLLALLLPAGIPTRAAPVPAQVAFDCGTVTEIPQSECEALVALYESTNGPNWTDDTGWLATNTPCSWFGVTCSAGRVFGLSLSNNNLNGQIPQEIGNLAVLVNLMMAGNKLSGSIPSEIGNLTKLSAFYLDNNQLSGIIPPEIGTLIGLKWFSLYNNQLEGAIPPQIGNLTALQFIRFYSNRLSGSIPPEIGNLAALTELRLDYNQLSGVIPPDIGNLTALAKLDLSHNQLSGSIPSAIANLIALKDLSLILNKLTGPIPPEIGNLTALKSLLLFDNQLSGPIPPEIGNLTALVDLRLQKNQLSGPIPAEIGNLTALQMLSLVLNQLSEPIPSEIGNLTNLQTLLLGSNLLSGPIPSEIGGLASLTNMDLSYNQLSGPVPAEIGNLSMLAYLSLNSNQLSGVIPSEISQLAVLKSMNLGSNQLSGEIPAGIGSLSTLENLYLYSNQLTGSIPQEMGQLTMLRTLNLAYNQLSGPIPSEIGSLAALYTLLLNGNQLSGTIPSEIGNLTTLGNLLLNNNQLNGPIPTSIGNLVGLRQLYLHNNPLTGEVPTSLIPLTLTAFSFYDTGWCVPSVGDVPEWLGTIANLYSTGLICGEGLGSLNGTVTLTNAMPVADVQVNLYRSTYAPQWQYLMTTHTAADGTYQFSDLGQGLGIDYRVQFVDPTHQLAPQYYEAKPTIGAATVITITPGVPRAGINAVLALPQPPTSEVETDTGSTAYNSDGTAQITMPALNPSDITITRAVTCSIGTPSAVTLTLSTGPQYAMTNVVGDLYRATIPAADLTGDATLRVIVTCNEVANTTVVGYLTLYDPSGIVTDVETEQPVAGATVTLYNIPGWEPKTGPDDDRPNTCESNLSKSQDEPWSQPAPTELGTIANADVMAFSPTLPYQYTTVAGYYGWDVPQGCWYVTVEAEGYEPLVSPVVGVPPEVTDLDLSLTPVSTVCTPLTDVGILGPLDVTSTLYINTLYTFQAIITPTGASEPITYTWAPEPQTGQGTDTATYRWSTPDTYTIALTVENCGGTVSTTRTFVIEDKDTFTVYLPLVLRSN